MQIKCVVACNNAAGNPDFYFCTVACTDEQYDAGEHCDVAEHAAREEGYEGPFVVYDEHDGPDWLFNYFVWASATALRVR